MPVTFGSVGDIVAIAQIAAQLLKALSSSNGSAQEFQDLLVQLRTFHRCLDQVGAKTNRSLAPCTDGSFLVSFFLADSKTMPRTRNSY